MKMLTFTLISAAIILVPGPNVLVIISTSISHGKIRGLQTVAGTSAAMLVQLILAALATTWLVNALTKGFSLLKWMGVLYLIYLGLGQILGFASGGKTASNGVTTFQRGFLVSITNPKTLLFFSTYLPQFTNEEGHYLYQIAVLSLIFWAMAISLDSAYALTSSKLAAKLESQVSRRRVECLGGFLYLGAGAALAATKEG
ncbi:Threonine/homoserine/homoserine lactone efflux protein [Alteromonadaceae bacterium Bs31]|nr:Threonine/homoserine/homoserine lactone efflux protein [Alteromonadaceae bacterium Bs31]